MKNILVETIFGNQLQKSMTLNDAINLLSEHELINIGELAELAISKKSGVDLCVKNTPDIDLVTGKQIKHAQTNPDNTSNGVLKAHISKRNITVPILAVVTERLTNKQYFFHFPYESYSWMNGNTFMVPFDLDGNPKRQNNWWDYEVRNFEELCELAK
jgi:hypothetical protein